MKKNVERGGDVTSRIPLPFLESAYAKETVYENRKFKRVCHLNGD